MDGIWACGLIGLLAWALVRAGDWASKRTSRSIHGMLDDSKPCAMRVPR